MPNLYQLSLEVQELDALLFELGGDVSDEDVEKFIDEWRESLDIRTEEKLNDMRLWIAERQSLMKSRHDEALRLMKLGDADKKAIERVKKAIHSFMVATGRTKVTLPAGGFSVAKNGGIQSLDYPERWDEEPASAPEKYHKIIVALDTALLRSDAEMGEAPEGVALRERGTHLRVK